MQSRLSVPQPDLLPTGRSDPGEYEALPTKRTEHVSGIADVVDFVFDYVSHTQPFKWLQMNCEI
jgi:hypothetical protein